MRWYQIDLKSNLSGAFAVTRYSKVTGPIYNGLVATNFDPWATFPIVQVLTVIIGSIILLASEHL